MARKITIAKFQEWIADEENVSAVLDRIAGGMTLHKASVMFGWPYTCLRDFFESTGERKAQYEAARKSWADAVMDEAIELADGCKPNKDDVAKAKLQIETRMNQAGAYHRDRWGQQEGPARGAPVTIQIANLRGGQLEVTTAAALPAPEKDAA